jgi:hypothetical protein
VYFLFIYNLINLLIKLYFFLSIFYKMKGIKLNLETVNCVLLVVILALVIYCVVKQNETFYIPQVNPMDQMTFETQNIPANNIPGQEPNVSWLSDGGGDVRLNSVEDPKKRCKEYAKSQKGVPWRGVRETKEGAPAGCIWYYPNEKKQRIVYVNTCKDHSNCGTTNCTNCKVLNV